MNTLNPWLILCIAIVVEVAGTLCLKLTTVVDGVPTKILTGTGVGVFYLATLFLMTIVVKQLDVGIAYAVWSGVGTALITISGIILFSESIAWSKLAGVVCIIAGVGLLHVSSKESTSRASEQRRQENKVSNESHPQQ